MQILDKDGNILDEWISTKEPHIIEGLKTGEEYTLKEMAAPKGYEITGEITFIIDETGKVTTTGKTATDKEGKTIILVRDEKTPEKIPPHETPPLPNPPTADYFNLYFMLLQLFIFGFGSGMLYLRKYSRA